MRRRYSIASWHVDVEIQGGEVIEHRVIRAVLLVACLVFPLAAAAADAPLNRALNEQVVFIRHGFGVELETTLFRPDGPGPFPLAVVNHGKEFGDSRFQPRARYIVAARELVRRGYAVAIPMRGGFSKSGGRYVDGGCNIEGNGRHQATYLKSALDWLVQQPWIDRQRIVVIGQSHGGLTAMAFATEPYEGVRGVINFAGGLRLTGNTCFAWENSLVDAFGSFGRAIRIPTLWFYGENDSYFGPALARRMNEAFAKSGGNGKLVAFGPFKNDAHRTFGDRDGLALWWPETQAFLAAIGMPTEPLQRALAEDPELAALADLKRIPNLSTTCERVYTLFLDADYPRAYAHSTQGGCGYAYGGENPAQRALEFCQRRVGASCRLYAVDDKIVWDGKLD